MPNTFDLLLPDRLSPASPNALPSDPFKPAAHSSYGTVYGTLLNEHAALEALGDAVHAPPYKQPPQAPVLYIKPRNTLNTHGAAVVVPTGVDALQMGATLGVVIGRSACRLQAQDALAHVWGYAVLNDICVPHGSVYRPAMRHSCRDGFCPISPAVPRAAVARPDDLAVTVSIDDDVMQRTHTGQRVRSVVQLLVDVTEFMTLHPGDVLSIGVAAGAPLARAGQRVRIEIAGVGSVENHLLAEELA